MGETTEIIRLRLQADQFAVEIQKQKDYIKDLNFSLKQTDLSLKQKKQLIIDKAAAERNLKDLQKQAKEAEKSIQNIGKSSKKSFTDSALAVALFGYAMKRLWSVTRDFIKAADPQYFDRVTQSFQKMKASIGEEIIQSLGENGESIQAITGFLGKATSMILEGFRIIGTNIGRMAFNTVSFFNAVYDSSVAIMSGLIDISVETFKAVKNVASESASGLIDGFKKYWNTGDFTAIGEGLGNGIANGIDNSKSNIENSKNSITGTLDNVKKTFTDTFAGMAEISLTAGATIKRSVDAMTESQKKALEVIKELNAADERAIDLMNDDGEARQKQINKLNELARAYDEVNTAKKEDESGLPDELQSALDKKQAYDMELQFLNQVHDLKLISEEQYLSRLKSLYEQYGFDSTGVPSAEAFQKKVNDYAQFAQAISNLGTQFNEYELQEINNRYDKEQQAVDKLYADKRLTEEEYAQNSKQIELKRQKDAEKIREQQKKYDIASALANTAVAVTGALGAKPWGLWNYALAALVGAAGLVQVQKIRKLALGGVANGPSHAQGGINIGGNQEIEGGEGVINRRSMANPYLYSAASMINQAGGGVAFPGTKRIMANGGVTYSFTGSSTARIERLLESVNRNIAGLELSVAVNNSASGMSMDRIASEVTKRQNRFAEKGGNLAGL